MRTRCGLPALSGLAAILAILSLCLITRTTTAIVPVMTVTPGKESAIPLVMKQPTPAPARPLLYSDGFNDSASGWPIDDRDGVTWSYQQDEYEIVIRNEDWWAAATAPVYVPECRVEADMRLVTSGRGAYGLILGWVNWDSFYAFVVYPETRSYGVYRWDGSWALVSDGGPTASLNPFAQNNHLAVERSGEQITAYANGHLLTTVRDENPRIGSRVGLFAQNESDTLVAVRFDNVRIRVLGSGYTHVFAKHSPQYITNFANSAGCNWLGVAGQVFNSVGDPAPSGSHMIHVTGSGIDQQAYTGSAQAYGPAGWEIYLGSYPRESFHRIQSFTATGIAVSPLYEFNTWAECEMNLVIVSFVYNNLSQTTGTEPLGYWPDHLSQSIPVVDGPDEDVMVGNPGASR